MLIKYAEAMYPIISFQDQNGEDKGGLSIEMCNTALVPDHELLNLVKEKYTWAGMNVKETKEFEYHDGTNENWSLVDSRRKGLNRQSKQILAQLIFVKYCLAHTTSLDYYYYYYTQLHIYAKYFIFRFHVVLY